MPAGGPASATVAPADPPIEQPTAHTEASATPTVGRRRSSAQVAVGLTLLVLASLLLRLQGIGIWYWIDEGLTVGLGRRDLLEIPGLLRGDGSPPLYYLLLNLWTSISGTGEVATRLLSLTFAALTVPAGFVAADRLFGRRPAWFTAGLFAFNPFLTHFSRETRMYTLVVLLGLVVVAAFIDGFVIGRRRSCAIFAASLVALLYTHNWALYVAVAAAAALLPSALAAERPRQVVRDGALTLAAVGAAYAPWLVVLVGQIDATGAPWSYTPTVREVIWEVSALVRDERVFLLLAVVAGGSLAQVVLRPSTIDGAIAWVLVTFAAVPVALGWAIAHVEPSWATRYLAVVVAPMVVLAGWGLSRAGAVGLLALVVAVGLWVQPLARFEGGLRIEPHGKSDGRALAAELDAGLARGDLVIVAQPEAVPLFDHYMDRDVRFATVYGGVIGEPSVMDWRGAPARLAAAQTEDGLLPLLRDLRPGQRIALVGPGGRLLRTDTDWIRDFHRTHDAWLSVLRTDGSLDRVDRIRSRLTGVAVPFVADVFEVVE